MTYEEAVKTIALGRYKHFKACKEKVKGYFIKI